MFLNQFRFSRPIPSEINRSPGTGPGPRRIPFWIPTPRSAHSGTSVTAGSGLSGESQIPVVRQQDARTCDGHLHLIKGLYGVGTTGINYTLNGKFENTTQYNSFFFIKICKSKKQQWNAFLPLFPFLKYNTGCSI